MFTEAARRIEDLLDACPERRDLVHGDLLHRNILLDEAGATTTGVFSWKCSVLGDFLYDVALCTFWGPWHPGVAALDAFRRVTADIARSADDRGRGLLDEAGLRHHCYELHIGATHLGWYAWTQDRANQRRLVAHLAALLQRGPLVADGGGP